MGAACGYAALGGRGGSVMNATGSGILLAHPSGNQFFRHLAQAFQRAGMLGELCTCIDWRGGGWRDALVPRGVATELGRRSFSRELGVPVASHPWREVARLVSGKLGCRRLTRHETGPFSVDAVYRDFDRWVAGRLTAAPGAGMVYAYEDAAEATFSAAKARGWRCVYDLPIAHWATSRRLLAEEAARLPEWEPTLVGTRDSPGKLARKERELALADVVVCPSRFVAESLPQAAREGKRIVVAPFGSPAAGGQVRTSAPAGKLRVLFAGSMSQRKGLADLFATMRGLRRSDVELVVLGSPVAAPAFYRRMLADFTYEPPRPHEAVLALMRTCDILCLPSIVEGRALVVQEALSCGLPAIITANTGADDAVEEGRSGFVVPIRSPEAIAEKIAWFAEHRAAWPEFSRAAQAAAARFTWTAYGETIVDALLALDGPWRVNTPEQSPGH